MRELLEPEGEGSSGGVETAEVKGGGMVGHGISEASPPEQGGEPDGAVGSVVGVGGPTDGAEGVQDSGILAVIERATNVWGHGSQ